MFFISSNRVIGYLLSIVIGLTSHVCNAGDVNHLKLQVYAHRGGRAASPENTLPAYRSALRIGTDWLDMDVVLTQDNEILVSHDLVLNPDIVRDQNGKFLSETRDKLLSLSSKENAQYAQKYAVAKLTLDDLRKFDVGRLNPLSRYAKLFPDQLPVDKTPMPTLREVIRFVNKEKQGPIGFQIEMKTDPSRPEISPDPHFFAKTLYQVLKEENILENVEVQAFDFRCLYELQKLDRTVKTAYLTSSDNERGGSDDFFDKDPKNAGLWTGGKLVKDYSGSIPRMVKALGGYAWEPEDAQLTRESLREAHQLGLKVVVWSWPEKLNTAFDAKLTEKMIQWGVDGIITDDPARLKSMLAARIRKAK